MINIVNRGIIHIHIALRDQKNALILRHGLLKRRNGFFAAHIKMRTICGKTISPRSGSIGRLTGSVLFFFGLAKLVSSFIRLVFVKDQDSMQPLYMRFCFFATIARDQVFPSENCQVYLFSMTYTFLDCRSLHEKGRHFQAALFGEFVFRPPADFSLYAGFLSFLYPIA